MSTNHNISFCALTLCTALFACSGNEDKTAAGEAMMSVAPDSTAVVKVAVLSDSEFNATVVSNGHIHARASIDLFAPQTGIVSKVFVHNGQNVTKGQKLVEIDKIKLESEKRRIKSELEQSKLDLQDVLIGQGYDPAKPELVPADVMQLARVRSGLEKAETSYADILADIEDFTIKSPINGVVANMSAVPSSTATPSDPVCRIISNSLMDVEFPVLESELPMVGVGAAIEVRPLANENIYTGRVVEINPLIDENGQVNVKAEISGTAGLIDGMNARIRVNRGLGQRLAVPKSAVVLRQNRQVVFTHHNGQAIWNYVTTGLENIDSYEIVEGLNPGDSVIISGNENLAHEAPVIIAR